MWDQGTHGFICNRRHFLLLYHITCPIKDNLTQHGETFISHGAQGTGQKDTYVSPEFNICLRRGKKEDLTVIGISVNHAKFQCSPLVERPSNF